MARHDREQAEQREKSAKAAVDKATLRYNYRI